MQEGIDDPVQMTNFSYDQFAGCVCMGGGPLSQRDSNTFLCSFCCVFRLLNIAKHRGWKASGQEKGGPSVPAWLSVFICIRASRSGPHTTRHAHTRMLDPAFGPLRVRLGHCPHLVLAARIQRTMPPFPQAASGHHSAAPGLRRQEKTDPTSKGRIPSLR